MPRSSRPNFLLIVTDQHRADHLGCYGNAVVRTQNIDSLAARGRTFDRFYVASPVCMPNRGSMFTGRMPSVHGVRSNGIPLPLEAVTLPDVLRADGYRTALVGKCHLQNMEDKPALVTRETNAGLEVIDAFPEATRRDFNQSEYQQERRSRWRDPEHRLRLPYYGFEHVELCNHHADETFGDWSRWAAAREPGVERLCGRENAIPDPRYSAPQAWRTRLPEELYSTNYIAERAAAYVDSHARTAAGQPFFLTCSFPDPHHPFTPPGRYWDMYAPADVPAPRTARDSAPHALPHVRWAHAERASGKAALDGPRLFAVSRDETRQIIALTYGMITMIDDAVGRILRSLERNGLAQDTVVIFTSDHGDLMGDHNLMLKGPIHYQGLVRVPFIWSDPQRGASERCAGLASSIDIAPTVLARAGIASPNGIQGRSLTEPIDDRDAVLIEEDNQRAFLGFDKPVRARTLVTKRHRLTLYRGAGWGELYDLTDDPLEERNLWDDPAATSFRIELTTRLARELMETCDRSPLPTQLA